MCNNIKKSFCTCFISERYFFDHLWGFQSLSLLKGARQYPQLFNFLVWNKAQLIVVLRSIHKWSWLVPGAKSMIIWYSVFWPISKIIPTNWRFCCLEIAMGIWFYLSMNWVVFQVELYSTLVDPTVVWKYVGHPKIGHWCFNLL